MLKQVQQLKLQQKLSPQQIQIVKLLELPTLQFEQRVKKELEENPLLEEQDEYTNKDEQQNEEQDENPAENEEFSIDDYIEDEDEMPSYRLRANNYSSDDKYEDIPFSRGESFHEHLERQLGLRIQLSEEERKIAEFIVGNIDEDGYLRRELDAIVDDLVFAANVDVDIKTLERLLLVVQDFDPPGVGARNLQECLALQLKKIKDRTDEQDKALQIITNYFDLFTKKNYQKLIKKLEVSRDELRDIVEEITRLNPKPGSAYSQSSTQGAAYITPDFIIEMHDGELKMSLNARNVPELRVSEQYKDVLRGSKKDGKAKKDAAVFVKQKINAAKWFVDAVRQRQQTLISVMNAIMIRQEKFFIDGDEKMLKPMILKDIAEDTDLDISTISRVSNSKYVQTHFGVFPLKYFFSESMMTESGEEVSTREIKRILQDCVDGEDKRKPLTDEKLAEILQEKSYLIARRTVAKYRENLGIPIARLRKEL
ncbi:RNA polymerase RpoN-/SigL-like sigma 54 subunit [Balneicella halophila]|uniref:RNA polymerase RpoN-/SigL-like sigma 54 subunit n=1 Tax=Balneicella halophila TaxID=1537566 RepID=A0A7L4UQC3_BALHA|nr:RNA polymerase factor sigma-54 [Balneicella halophila]PVX51975.1 RNA polymerase RpoN-/SigL-like sigma 54 subunit [Balneicella halophila]